MTKQEKAELFANGPQLADALTHEQKVVCLQKGGCGVFIDIGNGENPELLMPKDVVLKFVLDSRWASSSPNRSTVK